jgi:hypothetical protein
MSILGFKAGASRVSSKRYSLTPDEADIGHLTLSTIDSSVGRDGRHLRVWAFAASGNGVAGSVCMAGHPRHSSSEVCPALTNGDAHDAISSQQSVERWHGRLSEDRAPDILLSLRGAYRGCIPSDCRQYRGCVPGRIECSAVPTVAMRRPGLPIGVLVTGSRLQEDLRREAVEAIAMRLV